MRQFSLWLRRKPFVADSALALALFALEIVVAFYSSTPVAFVVFGALVCAPMPWRRMHPRSAAWSMVAVSWMCTVSIWLAGDTQLAHPGQLGTVIMLYTLVAYVGRRDGVAYLAVLCIDTTLSIVLLHMGVLTTVLFVVLVYALAWITAEFMGARRAYDDEVAARLAVAEYDRDRRAVDAVAAERTRIARELHDVVAHAVSVMIVQADGASYTLRRDPERAEAALRNISGTGRQALAELRRTVSLLRSDHVQDDLPQYGTAALAKIVDMMRKAGLRVELEQSGNLDDIGPAISLGVHRLVQESLTNVLRHAGQTSRASVTVRRRAADVLVEITDTGHYSDDANRRRPAMVGSGNGLLGMRERVAVLGGSLTAGREPDGSWLVRAELPLDHDERVV